MKFILSMILGLMRICSPSSVVLVVRHFVLSLMLSTIPKVLSTSILWTIGCFIWGIITMLLACLMVLLLVVLPLSALLLTCLLLLIFSPQLRRYRRMQREAAGLVERPYG